MKYVLMFLAVMLGTLARGSNVVWNFVGSGDYSQTGSLFYMGRDLTGYLDNTSGSAFRSLQVSLYAETLLDSTVVRISDVSCNTITSITWTRSEIGDLISPAGFGDGQQSLFSTEYTGGSGNMSAAKGSSFFLSFQVNELVQDYDPEIGYGDYRRGDSYYGWVEFTATNDGRLTVGESAIDLDGGAMIVGGGAIPEPTSGLLLLFGVAALALKRNLSDYV